MAIVSNERYAKYYHRIGIIYQRPEIKASLEVIFSVFMVVVLVFAAIRPTLTNLAALQKRILDRESLNTKADKKISQLFLAQEQISQNTVSLGLFDSAVPENFSYLDMIGRVEMVAKSSRVDVEYVFVSGTNLSGEGNPAGEWAKKQIKKETNGMMIVPVEFQVAGSPSQIRKFLIDIENMDRLALTKSVNLVKESGTAKGSEKIKASGQISFYVYQAKK